MNLTVVIPTIGRDSLENAINSALAVNETKQVIIVTDTTVKLKAIKKRCVKTICINQTDRSQQAKCGTISNQNRVSFIS